MVVEKETKLACALHCFCSFFVQAKRRKRKQEEKNKLEEKKSRYETLPLLVRNIKPGKIINFQK